MLRRPHILRSPGALLAGIFLVLALFLQSSASHERGHGDHLHDTDVAASDATHGSSAAVGEEGPGNCHPGSICAGAVLVLRRSLLAAPPEFSSLNPIEHERAFTTTNLGFDPPPPRLL